eukprot:CAMPEP_0197025484 /NCGR_PEP_ID=MMETSP1384-20130603/5806_1 /TAXON_ID=29189 /ORGANISM="Ammonia sp." /LENGTH=504 /DNA_ID=CAMNT_0042454017 /DNA_START=53 /DNA_END=1567 /DNA_ORIENTATION=-
MATAGQKRKLEDTDISKEEDVPTKQQKLMSSDASEAKSNPETSASTTTTTNTDTAVKPEEKTEMKTEQSEPDDDGLSKEIKNQVREQVEWYFGDSNYPLDGHIQYESRRNKGFFPIANLATFNNIEKLTNDVAAITKIIESSSKLQLNESKTGVRRHPSLPPPPTKQEIYSRSIFAKGFHPRMTLPELTTFWRSQTEDASKVLSVRTIKDEFEVGLAENNEQKKVRRFLGSCQVEFPTVELAQEFSKMTFTSHHRVIRCGMYEKYFTDDIEWSITRKYLPFESNKVMQLTDLPNHCTYCDIKSWICNALYRRDEHEKRTKLNEVAFVSKEMGSTTAYVRFTAAADIVKCRQKIKLLALMGMHPRLTILKDDEAQKVWKLVAEQKYDVNKDVHIKSVPKIFESHRHQNRNKRFENKADQNRNDNRNKQKKESMKQEMDDQQDDDVDLDNNQKDTATNNGSVTAKDEKEVAVNSKEVNPVKGNDKKHKLDDNESPQPTKKPKLNVT